MGNEITKQTEELKKFKLKNKVWQEQEVIINKKEDSIRNQRELIKTIHNSLSWRLTKPLRKIEKLFQKK